MTDNDTLADNNIKHFGKLSSNQVSCYQYSTGVDSESITCCPDRICTECGKVFRCNFEYAIRSIDMLPAIFKDCNGSNCKLQEFVK